MENDILKQAANRKSFGTRRIKNHLDRIFNSAHQMETLVSDLIYVKVSKRLLIFQRFTVKNRNKKTQSFDSKGMQYIVHILQEASTL